MPMLHTELQAHYIPYPKKHDDKQWGIISEGGQQCVCVCMCVWYISHATFAGIMLSMSNFVFRVIPGLYRNQVLLCFLSVTAKLNVAMAVEKDVWTVLSSCCPGPCLGAAKCIRGIFEKTTCNERNCEERALRGMRFCSNHNPPYATLSLGGFMREV